MKHHIRGASFVFVREFEGEIRTRESHGRRRGASGGCSVRPGGRSERSEQGLLTLAKRRGRRDLSFSARKQKRTPDGVRFCVVWIYFIRLSSLLPRRSAHQES